MESSCRSLHFQCRQKIHADDANLFGDGLWVDGLVKLLGIAG